MRKKVVLLAVSALVLATITPFANAAVKPGTACSKQGQTITYAAIKHTCIKSGKKLVWSKGVKVSTPAPTPTPTVTPSPTPTPTPTAEPIVLPTSFEDLYEKRKGVSLAAWQKSSEIIKSSRNKAGTLEILSLIHI